MRTGNGKIVAGLILLFIAVVGFIQGGINDLIPALIIAGVGVLLIHLKLTEKKRIDKRRFKEARLRFGNSNLASQVIQDLRTRNWTDLNYNCGGCRILTDRIATPYKTYLYRDYGLNDLDIKGCEQLALYIGALFGSEYRTEMIYEYVGTASFNSHSGYVGSDGSVSVSLDRGPDSIVSGYNLYSVASLPTRSEPQGKDW